MAPTTESYRKGLTPREAFFLSTLARAGKVIFSMGDARQILGARTRQTLSLLSQKKWVLRLKRGLYVIVPIDVGVRGSESFIVHDFVVAYANSTHQHGSHGHRWKRWTKKWAPSPKELETAPF